MAEMLIDGAKLDACLDAEADAIRAKTGGSSPIPYDYANNKGFADAIAAIPSGTTITDGIVVKARDANGYATEIDFYASDGVVQPYQFQVVNSNNSRMSETWRYLSKINFQNEINEVKAFAFAGVPDNFSGIDFSKLSVIGNFAFIGCTNLSGNIVLADNVQYGNNALNNSGITGLEWNVSTVPNTFLQSCTLLRHVSLPKATRFGGYTSGILNRCTALETVLLGGIGYGVTAWGTGNFQNCTQSGLTVTAFTNGSHVDGLLSNIRNGATNATIIIKASEATTYNGASYAAGDTILTSEVTA